MAVLGLGLAGAVAATTREFANGGLRSVVPVVVLVAGSVWFAGTRRTHLALAMLMLYLGCLDGYLKLSTGSSSVTLIRDVLLYAIVVGVLLRSQLEARRLSLPPLSAWVLAYVIVVLVQVANPSGGSLYHSIAGLRPHLEFIPLFFFGYAAVRDIASLRRVLFLLLFIAAANGIVGYIQFRLTPTQVAGWGPGYAQRILGTGKFIGEGRSFFDATGGVHTRPFGLGSDAGNGGMFGVLALGAFFALLASVSKWRHRLVVALCGVGAVVAIVTSEGRSVVVAGLVTVLAYGYLTATSQRRLASLAGLAVGTTVVYFVVAAILAGGGGTAFRYQGLSASKILQTTAEARPDQLNTIGTQIVNFPLGTGLGTAGPAAGTQGGTVLTAQVNAESEPSFLAVETGIPGIAVIVGFTAMLLFLGVTRCRREPDPEARLLLAAATCPVAGILISYYSGPATVTVPAGPYLWFAGGVISYWLVTLPAARRRQAALG